MGKVLLKDIAEKAGIGTASVSKALRGSHDISPKTINKVKKVAREMGYYPKQMAKAVMDYVINTIEFGKKPLKDNRILMEAALIIRK